MNSDLASTACRLFESLTASYGAFDPGRLFSGIGVVFTFTDSLPDPVANVNPPTGIKTVLGESGLTSTL